ncbi:uncharacterized protein LOC117646853 [Thrips palmi]|uniref:Uncharacterized protein LOC117646853 n=1 Tax=Thrips palmi TaxID=161013 RepID=A0A6P8Z2U0_THRPL|nr:uncharacterized protein LOC117646853 [Thrips palmi]
MNLVIISDHLRHVTGSVSKFQEVLMKFLKEKVPGLNKVIYFSDGCPGQYKNRLNTKNLLMHKEDYGVDAEWHFYATSHGKSPSDGLGGTLKRLATKASLQRPYDGQIQTPEDLFLWADENIKGLNCAYVKSVDVKKHCRKLNRRFQTAPAVTGIRSHHALIPVTAGSIVMKVLSRSASGKTVTLREEATPQDDDENSDQEMVADASPQSRLRPIQQRRSIVDLTNKTPVATTPTWQLSRLRRRVK